jgi:hypothetical protein
MDSIIGQRGLFTNPKIVADMANLLLVQRNSPLTRVGKCYVLNFIKRHIALKSKASRCLDYGGTLCNDPVLFNEWFKRVEDTIQQYNIVTTDIYNFDETGFQMGATATCKVVTSARTKGRPSVTQPSDIE